GRRRNSEHSFAPSWTSGDQSSRPPGGRRTNTGVAGIAANITATRQERAMRAYRYDHVHLRSPDPDATARFFETMFSAEVTRSIYPPGTLYPGQQRITMRLGGQTVLIAPPHPHEPTAPAPAFPYFGLEHIGLTV